MSFERSAGILLHPTSLPGEYGIGTLGAEALAFVDFLAETGQHLWQTCPLGPTGYGNSPYQCFSAFAGNPLLIDLELLVEDGLLEDADLADAPLFSHDRVDYPAVIGFKMPLLSKAYSAFVHHANAAMRAGFEEFCEEQKNWLDDYALFMAIKEHFGGGSWLEWDQDIRMRKPKAMHALANVVAPRDAEVRFVQYLFFTQWRRVHQYAKAKGVRLIGDIPIFVAFDSADAWSHPEIFEFDEELKPRVVAGVPPDYFCATGQLWGNPLYNWAHLKKTHFAWWIERMRASLAISDIIRIDHFRGFASCWAVPADHDTAEHGRWEAAKGDELLAAIKGALGDLQIIAEDLGVITPEVEALRDKYGLPGMKILQFAFDSAEDNDYLPHNYPLHSVVYTGTHDNDTTRGWYQKAAPSDRAFAREYLRTRGSRIAWDFVRSAWAATSVMAIAPMQDLLDLGSDARMNLPGTAGGNWEWRFTWRQLPESLVPRLAKLTRTYRR